MQRVCGLALLPLTWAKLKGKEAQTVVVWGPGVKSWTKSFIHYPFNPAELCDVTLSVLTYRWKKLKCRKVGNLSNSFQAGCVERGILTLICLAPKPEHVPLGPPCGMVVHPDPVALAFEDVQEVGGARFPTISISRAEISGWLWHF